MTGTSDSLFDQFYKVSTVNQAQGTMFSSVWENISISSEGLSEQGKTLSSRKLFAIFSSSDSW